MIRPTGRLVALAVGLSLLAVGCGEEIQVAEDDPLRAGAELFQERCSGCHTLEAANAEGSKPEGQAAGGERTNGPNFDQRKETYDDALFAIQNGGFSGAIMPANVVVGQDAEDVAAFLSKYAGRGGSDVSEQQSPSNR